MKKWSIVLAALSLAVGIGGTARAEGASGGAYPPKKPTVTVSSPVVGPGVGFTITAKGFCPGEPITFVLAAGDYYFYSEPVISDASGTAVYEVDPKNVPFSGIYTVYAKILTGPCAGQAALTTITVLPACTVGLQTDVTQPICVDDDDDDDDDDPVDGCDSADARLEVTLTTVDDDCEPTECDSSDLRIEVTPATVDDDCEAIDDCDTADAKLDAKLEVTPTTVDDSCPAPCVVTNGLTVEIIDLPVCPVAAGGSGTPGPVVAGAVVVDNAQAGPLPATVAGSQAAQQLPAAVVAAAAVSVPASVLSSGLVAGASASPAAFAAPRGNLPVTGSEPSPTLQVAWVLLTSGLGMLVITGLRRRKQASSAIAM